MCGVDAALSGYPAFAMCASITAAVHCVLAKTQWDVSLTMRWVTFLSARLLQSLSDTVGDLLTWLSRSATWSSYLMRVLAQGFVLTGPWIFWRFRACPVDFLQTHGWTGESTGGGGLWLRRCDALSGCMAPLCAPLVDQIDSS